MVNKTIIAELAILVIVICNMLTLGEERITYGGIAVIGSLGGLSLWRNHTLNKKG